MSIFSKISEVIKDVANIDAHIDTDAAERSIRNNIVFKGPNAWILAIAIIIASVGLNVNSIPVIIGAMLISPLMGPIFGLGLGLGINDIDLMKQAGKNLLIMVSISLAVSLLYFLITPLSLSNPTEILARTKPTIFDVMIALFGGFAGIFEQCRKDKGTVFSGVAIATALMPPLCTAGFGLASGNMGCFIGAIYLFCINCLFITLATYFLVRHFKFKQKEYADTKFGLKTKRYTTLLILIFLVPSVWSAVVLVKQTNFEKKAMAFVEKNRSYDKSIIYDYKIDHENGSILSIFLTGDTLTESARHNIYAFAKECGISEEQLIIKEYITNNPQQDGEVFKGIYERLDAEIETHEKTIDQLRQEIMDAKKNEIPHLQLANEISATHPEIRHLYIGQGVHVEIDSLNVSSCLIVKIKTDSLMTQSSVEQLKKWLQIRLQVEHVEIDNAVVEIIPAEAPATETSAAEQ